MRHAKTDVPKRVGRVPAALLALLAGGAHAAPPAPPVKPPPTPPRHELTVGVTSLQYLASQGSSATHHTADIAYHRKLRLGQLPEAVRLGIGVRVGVPDSVTLPLEAYGRVQLVAKVGPWSPALGPEVGVSGFTRLRRSIESPSYPRGLSGALQDRMGPFYAGITLAPLRFVLGPLTLSAAELQTATPLKDPGSALRLQVGLLYLGGVL
ncbi:hypothetical protein JRI60_03365 [Archangium violaceum]|uniref:hypothetical protein n=1 Tax=Archangium violaceum TaxID=83451 RepID=UPI00194F3973|nr:hypothetical protein [Archangium violaceum]QRN98127.1 hypothetical protein JRI60_03365 [Archangium violaceum]